MGSEKKPRYCKNCNEEFNSNRYNRLYCCEACKREYAKKQKLDVTELRKIKVKEKNTELSRLSKEAREHGMNYGMYVGIYGL